MRLVPTKSKLGAQWNVPAYASNLKKHEVRQIERVQKAALAIICYQRYVDYENALKLSGLQSPASRRKQFA